MASPTLNATAQTSLITGLSTKFDRVDLRDSSDTVLRTFTVSFNVSGGTMSLASAASASDAVAGTAAEARVYHSSGADEIVDLLVSEPGSTAWATATAYSVNDKRTNGGRTYICSEAHTSDADTEPGVGDAWKDVWDQVHITLDNLVFTSGQQVDLNSLAFDSPTTLE